MMPAGRSEANKLYATKRAIVWHSHRGSGTSFRRLVWEAGRWLSGFISIRVGGVLTGGTRIRRYLYCFLLLSSFRGVTVACFTEACRASLELRRSSGPSDGFNAFSFGSESAAAGLGLVQAPQSNLEHESVKQAAGNQVAAVWSCLTQQRWRITRIICLTCGFCRLGEGLEAIAGYDSLLRLKPWVLSLRERPDNLEMLGGGAPVLLLPTLPSTTPYFGTIGQVDGGFLAGISLSKLWRHPGKGCRGTCRNRRHHPTAKVMAVVLMRANKRSSTANTCGGNGDSS
ncbi:hypothetical protein V8C26DRAFT_384915 [Trichoderma gracile]